MVVKTQVHDPISILTKSRLIPCRKEDFDFLNSLQSLDRPDRTIDVIVYRQGSIEGSGISGEENFNDLI